MPLSHVGYACHMPRATSINGNLINKRGTFDDSQVSTAEADIKDGQKKCSGARRTGDDGLEVGGIERQSTYANNTS